MTTQRFRRIIPGLVVLAAGVLLCVSLGTFDPHEGPFPNYPPNMGRYANLCGAAGAYISAYAFAMFGWVYIRRRR